MFAVTCCKPRFNDLRDKDQEERQSESSFSHHHNSVCIPTETNLGTWDMELENRRIEGSSQRTQANIQEQRQSESSFSHHHNSVCIPTETNHETWDLELENRRIEVSNTNELSHNLNAASISYHNNIEDEARYQNNYIKPEKEGLPCPECPVCIEKLMPPTRIMQCSNGHLICEDCVSKANVIDCPTCRMKIVGRATALEQHLAYLFQGSI